MRFFFFQLYEEHLRKAKTFLKRSVRFVGSLELLLYVTVRALNIIDTDLDSFVVNVLSYRYLTALYLSVAQMEMSKWPSVLRDIFFQFDSSDL